MGQFSEPLAPQYRFLMDSVPWMSRANSLNKQIKTGIVPIWHTPCDSSERHLAMFSLAGFIDNNIDRKEIP
ncbi:MAG: hypothetical protein ACQEXG_08890 [Pseudomonadota bacterium]